MTDDIEARRKRAIYRANYRGFREADMMLGGFAKAHGPDFTDDELREFEALIEESDHNIYDWITGNRPLPAQYDTALFARLKAFDPIKQ